MSWGLCQIQYRTAIRVGGLATLREAGGFPAVFDALGNPDRAKAVALTILGWCFNIRHKHSVLGLAACYNGANMDFPPTQERISDLAEQDPDRWTDKRVASYRRLRAYAENVRTLYLQKKAP